MQRGRAADGPREGRNAVAGAAAARTSADGGAAHDPVELCGTEPASIVPAAGDHLRRHADGLSRSLHVVSQLHQLESHLRHARDVRRLEQLRAGSDGATFSECGCQDVRFHFLRGRDRGRARRRHRPDPEPRLCRKEPRQASAAAAARGHAGRHRDRVQSLLRSDHRPGQLRPAVVRDCRPACGFRTPSRSFRRWSSSTCGSGRR